MPVLLFYSQASRSQPGSILTDGNQRHSIKKRRCSGAAQRALSRDGTRRMTDVKTAAQYAINHLEDFKHRLIESENVDQVLLSQLLKKLEVIDDYYKTTCEEGDEQEGLEPGTTYKTGYNMEFYIESIWWDDVSQIFRKIKAKRE